ncbi:SpoIIE family protein phosphatase [Streptomyces collinus]|uniref:SpoIIE family protein phosphatase n=1 Tax=Streptomyces collinus TaxID=42684 RepID=UPI003426F3D4
MGVLDHPGDRSKGPARRGAAATGVCRPRGRAGGRGGALERDGAQVLAALRGIVVRSGDRPAAVMSELNAYLHRYHRGQMATACYLLYRRSTRTSTYVKAGHPPPLVVAGDGTSECGWPAGFERWGWCRETDPSTLRKCDDASCPRG